MNDSGWRLKDFVKCLSVAKATTFCRSREDPSAFLGAASLQLVSGLKDISASGSWGDFCDRKDADRNGTAFLGSTSAHVRCFEFVSPDVSGMNCKGKRDDG